jgi:hypothetical protein
MFLEDYNGLKPWKDILSRCLLENNFLALIFVRTPIKSLTRFPMSFIHLSLSGIHWSISFISMYLELIPMITFVEML